MGESAFLACTPGEGTGNRLLLARAEDAEDSDYTLAALAQRACGREWDGLLLLGPEHAEGREARILNRDGSDGGVCLNGLRVAALWEARAGKENGVFRMAGRVLPWQRVPDGVQLRLRREDLPAELRLHTVAVQGLRGLAVPFWNPHCVVPVPELRGLNLRALAGEVARRRELFPDGVNVEAVSEAGPGRIQARVWERGVGETRACGSGAVAIALAAWASGGAGPLDVLMPGGSLRLAPAPDGGILLTGAATLGEPLELALD